MERLGARRGAIRPALGPCIAQASYEVGPEFVAAFAEAGEDTRRFFVASRKPGHSMFDLSGYIAERVARAGVGGFEDLRLDTYADETPLLQLSPHDAPREPDYGRLVSAIVLR